MGVQCILAREPHGDYVGGEQCDRYGPARPLAAGLSLFACGLTISGLAPEMWVLVIGRGVQGLGAGAVPAVAYVTIWPQLQ